MKKQFTTIFLGPQCDFFPTDVAMTALLIVKIRFVITQFLPVFCRCDCTSASTHAQSDHAHQRSIILATDSSVVDNNFSITHFVTHPASRTMGTGSFPGVKYGRSVLLTTHPLLVSPSRKSRAIPLPILWATTGSVTGKLYLLPLPPTLSHLGRNLVCSPTFVHRLCIYVHILQ